MCEEAERIERSIERLKRHVWRELGENNRPTTALGELYLDFLDDLLVELEDLRRRAERDRP